MFKNAKKLPPGEYKVLVTEFIKSVHASHDSDVFTWNLKIIDGPYTGMTITKRYFLKNEICWIQLYRELQNLGIISSPENAAEHAEALVKNSIQVEITYSDEGYQQVYFREANERIPRQHLKM